MTTGAKIRFLREKKKMSQEELAFAVGVSQVSIGNWEQDKSIKHNFINKLAIALDVSVSFLLEDILPDSNQFSNKELTENQLKDMGKPPIDFFNDLNKKMDFIISHFKNFE